MAQSHPRVRTHFLLSSEVGLGGLPTLRNGLTQLFRQLSSYRPKRAIGNSAETNSQGSQTSPEALRETVPVSGQNQPV